MDDSQSSDVFSNSGDFPCGDYVDMDNRTYESLILNTKALLSRSCDEVNKAKFSSYFSPLLDDCATCCIQTLDFVARLLSENEINVVKLYTYLEDAIFLLQSLTNLIKNVSLMCCNFKTFPTTAGRIIMTVFVHCKDSEFIYGKHIKLVEKQLKQLFKVCHDLQLMYLNILDKHYNFDVDDNEDLNILIEVLDINVEIGEIVQTLDVKTMAEQWKGIIAISEKYSNSLQDKPILTKCSTLLCNMVENNMKTGLQAEDEKIMLRSLKVSSFMLKILMKICNIFKGATHVNYTRITEVLVYIHLHNPSYLESVTGKSQQFLKLISGLLITPSDALLKDLVLNQEFVETVQELDIFEWREEDKLLAYILLIISAIKALLQHNTVELGSLKVKIIDCLFKALPLVYNQWLCQISSRLVKRFSRDMVTNEQSYFHIYNISMDSTISVDNAARHVRFRFDSQSSICVLDNVFRNIWLFNTQRCHIYFNIGLKFDTEANSNFKSQGLYEHLLTHTLALASSFRSEEVIYLERKMCEALLSTETYSAMFSCNLWILLSRISNRQFTATQTLSLIKMYKKLEVQKLFSNSPQDTHLRFLLEKLFENLNYEDKLRIYKQYDVNEENFKLWTALKISSLPESVQRNAEEFILEKLDTELGKLFNGSFAKPEDILITIKTMNVASTCTIQVHLNDIIIEAWLKACPKSNRLHIMKEFHKGSRWFYDYIAALTRLTSASRDILRNSANIVKILHVAASLIENGSLEMKFILKSLVIQISDCQMFDKNKELIESLLKKALINLDVLEEAKELNKEDLIKAMDIKYCHKCIESKESIIELSCSTVNEKTNSKNFDFADLDTLFEAESDSEPACKKIKLRNDEVEEIVSRLESDTLLLCDMKENVVSSEYKSRIISVCDNLRNILN